MFSGDGLPDAGWVGLTDLVNVDLNRLVKRIDLKLRLLVKLYPQR